MKSLQERFEDKYVTEPNSGCWLWIGTVAGKGYGYMRLGRRAEGMEYAHRIAWMLAHGPIPKGLVIDHLCRNIGCVNIAHLDLTTNRENILRGEHLFAQLSRSGVCIHGHGGDAIFRDNIGRRRCRACKRRDNQQAYLRRKGHLVSVTAYEAYDGA